MLLGDMASFRYVKLREAVLRKAVLALRNGSILELQYLKAFWIDSKNCLDGTERSAGRLSRSKIVLILPDQGLQSLKAVLLYCS